MAILEKKPKDTLMDFNNTCLYYIAISLGLWIAIPVLVGALPALGISAFLTTGIMLVAAAPAFASLFMSKIYFSRAQKVPEWNLVGRLLIVLVPVFFVMSLLLNGLGNYIIFAIMSAGDLSVPAPNVDDIWNVQTVFVANTVFSAILGIGVIFPIRARGEERKAAYKARDLQDKRDGQA